MPTRLPATARVVTAVATAAMAAALLLVAPPSPAAGAEADSADAGKGDSFDYAKVDTSIDKAVAWIYSQQQPDGTWEKTPKPDPDGKDFELDGGQYGGPTALAVYSLLIAGEKPTDPRITKAVDFLKKANMKGVYALAMRCQVWLYLPPTKDIKAAMTRDARALQTAVQNAPRNRTINNPRQVATWDYTLGGTGYSLSRTQYALLALWAASQLGNPSPDSFWLTAEKTWVDAQFPDGSWGYKFQQDATDPATIGMTAAGLATLYIADEFTLASKLAGTNGNPPMNPSVVKGMQWMLKQWPTEMETHKSLPRVYPFTAWYAVERVGLASGLRTFDDIDWYARGVSWILQEQRRDGSFSTSTSRGQIKGLVDTCFAVLFLARGRVPVVINKLDYSAAAQKPKDAAWNQRPRDVANLTRYVIRNIERELRWQIVAIDDTDAALAEAPVLYLSGTRDLDLTDAGKAKLKTYIDSGGMLLVNADGGATGRAFAASMQKVLGELYPVYEFRELPDDHPIYTDQVVQRSTWHTKPRVQGMSNGIRELALVIPSSDAGRAWQLQKVETKSELWELGLDVVSYAGDKTQFSPRGRSTRLTLDAGATAKQSIRVALLKYNGNWNPEPAAWDQLSIFMTNHFGAEVKPEWVELGKPIPDGVKVAHLTGTTAFKLDEAARQNLKKFVDAGGMLIVDAAGGSGEFTLSARGELSSLFGKPVEAKLTLANPLFARPQPLKEVTYRAFASRSITPTNDLLLEMIEQDGRPAVVFSSLDLTGGLVGYQIDGIPGYTPESAREVMARLVMSAK